MDMIQIAFLSLNRKLSFIIGSYWSSEYSAPNVLYVRALLSIYLLYYKTHYFVLQDEEIQTGQLKYMQRSF